MGAVVQHREQYELHEGVRVEEAPEVDDHPHGRRLDRLILRATSMLRVLSAALSTTCTRCRTRDQKEQLSRLEILSKCLRYVHLDSEQSGRRTCTAIAP